MLNMVGDMLEKKYGMLIYYISAFVIIPSIVFCFMWNDKTTFDILGYYFNSILFLLNSIILLIIYLKSKKELNLILCLISFLIFVLLIVNGNNNYNRIKILKEMNIISNKYDLDIEKMDPLKETEDIFCDESTIYIKNNRISEFSYYLCQDESVFSFGYERYDDFYEKYIKSYLKDNNISENFYINCNDNRCRIEVFSPEDKTNLYRILKKDKIKNDKYLKKLDIVFDDSDYYKTLILTYSNKYDDFIPRDIYCYDEGKCNIEVHSLDNLENLKTDLNNDEELKNITIRYDLSVFYYNYINNTYLKEFGNYSLHCPTFSNDCYIIVGKNSENLLELKNSLNNDEKLLDLNIYFVKSGSGFKTGKNIRENININYYK